MKQLSNELADQQKINLQHFSTKNFNSNDRCLYTHITHSAKDPKIKQTSGRRRQENAHHFTPMSLGTAPTSVLRAPNNLLLTRGHNRGQLYHLGLFNFQVLLLVRTLKSEHTTLRLLT